MKTSMNLQPYCEECPYFNGVLVDSEVSSSRQKVFANGAVYHLQPNSERTIEIHCGNEIICKRVAEVSTSTALAYEKEIASLANWNGVHVGVLGVDDMENQKGGEKLMRGCQDRFGTVVRKMKTNTTAFQVGDQVTIPLEGFGVFTATAQKVGSNGTLFLFDDSVVTRQMNEEDVNKGGYTESELRKWIDEKLFGCFPRDWQLRIRELTLPTYGQIFGHDDFYEKFEPDEDEQFPLMKDRKNRIAFLKGEWEWYWLKNATKKIVSAAAVAGVNGDGGAGYHDASISRGVRPVFLVG